ncbi:hypothetical protein MJO28_007177 [Puccinia striiformis f. sp. tritici]|nr:hypothetical protein MJO28_007177 [Puccinia striiformis f. sp. tritici]POW22272.1 hypothetical protein PSHT_01430 [Puccinia striiformis]
MYATYNDGGRRVKSTLIKLRGTLAGLSLLDDGPLQQLANFKSPKTGSSMLKLRLVDFSDCSGYTCEELSKQFYRLACKAHGV